MANQELFFVIFFSFFSFFITYVCIYVQIISRISSSKKEFNRKWNTIFCLRKIEGEVTGRREKAFPVRIERTEDRKWTRHWESIEEWKEHFLFQAHFRVYRKLQLRTAKQRLYTLSIVHWRLNNDNRYRCKRNEWKNVIE